MIPSQQLFLDFLVAFDLLVSYFEDVEGGHLDVRGRVVLPMREELDKFWSDEFEIFFLAVRVIPSEHFLLSLNEVKHEAPEGFVQNLSEIFVGHGQLCLERNHLIPQYLR